MLALNTLRGDDQLDGVLQFLAHPGIPRLAVEFGERDRRDAVVVHVFRAIDAAELPIGPDAIDSSSTTSA